MVRAPVFLLAVLVAAPASGQSPARRLLAEGPGLQGQVRVEEGGGLRVLTIDGVVQGAMPEGGEPGALAAEPLVDLARALRPEARTVLVIGLGTGQTAAAFARAGLEVEAVEIEPLVVECARRFFGWRGSAAVGDGRVFLERADRRWDLVVLDALTARSFPSGSSLGPRWG